jgi:hypothetical protein
MRFEGTLIDHWLRVLAEEDFAPLLSTLGTGVFETHDHVLIKRVHQELCASKYVLRGAIPKGAAARAAVVHALWCIEERAHDAAQRLLDCVPPGTEIPLPLEKSFARWVRPDALHVIVRHIPPSSWWSAESVESGVSAAWLNTIRQMTARGDVLYEDVGVARPDLLGVKENVQAWNERIDVLLNLSSVQCRQSHEALKCGRLELPVTKANCGTLGVAAAASEDEWLRWVVAVTHAPRSDRRAADTNDPRLLEFLIAAAAWLGFADGHPGAEERNDTGLVDMLGALVLRLPDGLLARTALTEMAATGWDFDMATVQDCCVVASALRAAEQGLPWLSQHLTSARPMSRAAAFPNVEYKWQSSTNGGSRRLDASTLEVLARHVPRSEWASNPRWRETWWETSNNGHFEAHAFPPWLGDADGCARELKRLIDGLVKEAPPGPEYSDLREIDRLQRLIDGLVKEAPSGPEYSDLREIDRLLRLRRDKLFAVPGPVARRFRSREVAALRARAHTRGYSALEVALQRNGALDAWLPAIERMAGHSDPSDRTSYGPIAEFARQKGIRLYHFTDTRHWDSIQELDGLYSRWFLARLGLHPPYPGGDNESWSDDQKRGTHDDVHLSFVRHHPMEDAVRWRRHSATTLLGIDLRVLDLPGVRFCDRNALSGRAKYGTGLDFFKHRIDWDLIVRRRAQPGEFANFNGVVPDALPYPKFGDAHARWQAETLVPEHVPMCFITKLR